MIDCFQHTYLSHYGYLPRSDLETRAMRTDDEFRSAIRRLQTFGSIPVTVGSLSSADRIEDLRRRRSRENSINPP